MHYQNAAELLPTELLEALQGYLNGDYPYIPRRVEYRRAWGERARWREETLARNRAIFWDYTAGLGVDELSARYLLAPESTQRILTLGRRGLLEPQSCVGTKHVPAQFFFDTVFAAAPARPALLQRA